MDNFLSSHVPPPLALGEVTAHPSAPCLELLGSREYELGAAWGLWDLDVAEGTVCVFRRLEGAVARWQEHHGAGPPPSSVLLQGLHGPAGEVHGRRAHPGLLCTLATSRSSHPIDVRRRSFLGTPQKLQLMRFDSRDLLSTLLVAESAGVAHSMLFRGVSACTSARIFSWARQYAGLPTERPWRVMLQWAGAGTFAAGLRQLGQPYEVVGASECDGTCRRLLEAQYPDVPVWPDAGSVAATVDAPPSDVCLGGFPCTTASGLNRHATSADVQRTLDNVDAALDYVRHHRPRLVVLENVTRWLHTPLRWGLDHLTVMLDGLPYRWQRCLMCPSQCGGPMARPRLVWVGIRAY